MCAWTVGRCIYKKSALTDQLTDGRTVTRSFAINIHTNTYAGMYWHVLATAYRYIYLLIYNLYTIRTIHIKIIIFFFVRSRVRCMNATDMHSRRTHTHTHTHRRLDSNTRRYNLTSSRRVFWRI